MTKAEKIKFKLILLSTAATLIKNRIAVSSAAILQAQSAANEEEKSSAGDKYETSRAMSHIEKDMFTKQLASNNEELSSLLSIPADKIYETVQPGAVIICTDHTFFVSAGLGKVAVNGKDIYFLSPKAPLSGVLHLKKAGGHFLFNGKEQMIDDVF